MSEEFEKILQELKKEVSDNKTLDLNNSNKEDTLVKTNDINVAKTLSVNDISYDIDKKAKTRHNMIWDENKETLLFFIIISVIVILIGLVSGHEYITVIGSTAFLLSSTICFLSFYGYIRNISSKGLLTSNLDDRVSKLERKVNYIMQKKADSFVVQDDIKSEIEEIKAILKTIINNRYGGQK